MIRIRWWWLPKSTRTGERSARDSSAPLFFLAKQFSPPPLHLALKQYSCSFESLLSSTVFSPRSLSSTLRHSNGFPLLWMDLSKLFVTFNGYSCCINNIKRSFGGWINNIFAKNSDVCREKQKFCGKFEKNKQNAQKEKLLTQTDWNESSLPLKFYNFRFGQLLSDSDVNNCLTSSINFLWSV